MRGPNRKERFHYLGVLEALHKRCEATHRKRGLTIQLGPVYQRLRNASPLNALVEINIRFFGNSRGKTKKLLMLSADKARRLEQELLANIEEVTGEPARDKGIRPRPWPPRLSNQEITERFVALALGLHAEGRMSEDPNLSLMNAIQSSAKAVVAPALAWSFQMEVSELHEDSQPKALQALCDNLPYRLQVSGSDKLSLAESLGELPRRIRLASAWHDVLAKDLGLGEDATLKCLGKEVVDNLSNGSSANNRAALFPKLQSVFGWGEAGTARALAIEHCRKAGGLTARVDTRLTLLQAAHSQHVRPFRELLDHQPDTGKLAAKPNNPTRADAIQLAGEAFWLSRACFRKTANTSFSVVRHAEANFVSCDKPERRYLDQWSTLAYERLTLALTSTSLDNSEIITLHRFRAGFATNPRYWRSLEVIEKAAFAVSEYAARSGANPALVEHFKARLAWMEAVDAKGELDNRVKEIFNGYNLCLTKAGSDFSGLDAEAPVHFFPEVLHLLQLSTQGSGGPQRDLWETVDFILSRNFGVYMDMETELLSIKGGLQQAGCAHEVLRVRAGRPKTDARV